MGAFTFTISTSLLNKHLFSTIEKDFNILTYNYTFSILTQGVPPCQYTHASFRSYFWDTKNSCSLNWLTA